MSAINSGTFPIPSIPNFLPDNSPAQGPNRYVPHLEPLAGTAGGLNPPLPIAVPHASPQKNSESQEIDKIAQIQLEGLIRLCKECFNKPSLKALLQISWGIGCIDPKMKFSKASTEVISEHQWILLEDISRQMAQRYPAYPLLMPSQENETKALLEKIKQEVLLLGKAFIAIKIRQANLKSNRTRVELKEITSEFMPGFDQFVLAQMARNIKIVLADLKDQNPVEWLKEEVNVKALLRTLEVIGEATKIVSETTLSNLPTLTLGRADGSGKAIWRKLRNMLHHNKTRSQEIGKYTPELFQHFLTTILPALLDELSKQEKNEANSTPLSKKNIRILELVKELCSDEHYSKIRHKWNKIQNQFKEIPRVLVRSLFGVHFRETEDGFEEDKIDYQTLCALHVQRYLKEDGDIVQVLASIRELKRLGQKVGLEQGDIEVLGHSEESLDKQTVVSKLKALLRSVHPQQTIDQNKAYASEFKGLVDQLVFVNAPANGVYTRDNSKYQECQQLMAMRMGQAQTFQVSIRMFQENSSAHTQESDNYARELDGELETRKNEFSQPIQAMISHLEVMKRVFTQNKNPSPKSPEEDAKEKYLRPLFKDSQKARQAFIREYEKLRKIDESIRLLGSSWIEAKEQVKVIIDKFKRLEETTQSISDCLAEIDKLLAILNDLVRQDNLFKGKLREKFIEVIDMCVEYDGDPNQKTRQRSSLIREIFTKFFTFRDENLGRIRSKLLNRLESLTDEELELKVDRLTATAKDEDGVTYVQQVLGSFLENPEESSLTGLRVTYCAAFDPVNVQRRTTKWNNLMRRMKGQLLDEGQIAEVKSWFSPLAGQKEADSIQKTLVHYLEGNYPFALNEFDRADHSFQKCAQFMEFLDQEVFNAFPHLSNRRDRLLQLFKVGNRISEENVREFPRRFVRKIEQLGKLYLTIKKREQQSPPASDKDLLLLVAEYEIQSIGELAQYITERPKIWNLGRHLLSYEHLEWMSLMRKLMAHYPLFLSPEVLRWNLGYLAVDTATASYLVEAAPSSDADSSAGGESKRSKLSFQTIHDKKFDLLDAVDKCGFSASSVEVLFPSFNQDYLEFLNPMGDFGLLVHPGSSGDQTDHDFMHGLMELGLILSYELNAKVHVVGKRAGRFWNVPTRKQIPNGCLEALCGRGQKLDEWLSSQQTYELYKNEPWSAILFQKGKKVSRADHEQFLALRHFFSIIGFEGNQEDIDRFLQQPNFFLVIANELCKMMRSPSESYQGSPIYKWIRCLFERFSPPGTRAKHTVRLPHLEGIVQNKVFTVDTNDRTLEMMAEELEDLTQAYPSCRHYYNGQNRIDKFNGRSLLDPTRPLSESEIDRLARYAATLLAFHRPAIVEMLNPINSLEKKYFVQAVSAQIDDPILVENPPQLDALPDGIDSLLRLEAGSLALEFEMLVSDTQRMFGPGITQAMIEWMEVDKEIEEVGRDYYGKHRIRLKRPFLLMDVNSRKVFERLNVSKGVKWTKYPFITCYQKFIDRIRWESIEFHVGSHPHTGILSVSGSFSLAFRKMVPEIETLNVLSDLMKRRELIMHQAMSFFQAAIPGSPKDNLNALYTDWNHLFRMVQDPNVFRVLSQRLIRRNTSFNNPELVDAMIRDFTNQYQRPFVVGEHSVARTDEDQVVLWDARNAFNRRNEHVQARSKYSKLMDLPDSNDFKREFLKSWESLYGESFGPQSSYDVLFEVITILDFILNNHKLCSFNEEAEVGYIEFWRFLRNNPRAKMHALWMSSGILSTVNRRILSEKITFEDLVAKEPIRAGLVQNRRVAFLIRSYLSFVRLEGDYSELVQYLMNKSTAMNECERGMTICQNNSQEQWRIEEYKKRLEVVEKRLKKKVPAYLFLWNEMKNAPFFKMVKLSVQFLHYIDLGKILSESELEIEALKGVVQNSRWSEINQAINRLRTSMKDRLATLNMSQPFQ